jgi:HPt (histidine-containing phosphotransfer) domain-containing protein
MSMTGDQTIAKIKIYLSQQFHIEEEQIELMLPGFVSTLHSHLNRLEKAIDGKALETIGSAAHTIKGALLNLGLEECARTASLIEEKGRSGGGVTEFLQLFDNLRGELTSVLSSYPAKPE